MTGRGGRLVNVGARSAQAPTGGSVGYTVAKAGVAAMTLALADELASDAFGDGIRVNAILPATIDTPANRAAMPSVRSGALAQAGRDRADDRLAHLPGEHRHVGRAGSGLTRGLGPQASGFWLRIRT